MDQIPSFEEFLNTQSYQLPLWNFAFNLLLAAILGLLLATVYVHYATSLSNRRRFAGNFVLLAMTTFLIISVVKSSIALSLGLVGALSIVRFRAAIKEPEELAYLFLTIGIGLGLGADQRGATLVAFVLIVGVLILKHVYQNRRTPDQPNLYLTIGHSLASGPTLSEIVETLKPFCSDVDLKRFDQDAAGMEAAFMVRFASFTDLEAGTSALRKLDQEVHVTLLESHDLGGGP